MIDAPNLRDWAPIRVYGRPGSLFVDWCYIGAQRFTHPFFNDTIHREMARSFNVLFRHQTPIEFLRDLTARSEVIPPSGFIFHMSRCGSTLVAQMFAALQANVVISEAPPIDSVIRWHRGASNDGESSTWLTSMIGTFGRRRFAEERNYFIKFDSWNTLDIDFVLRAYPDVPWIFLYRNPVEVIVSQMRQRGSQMVPGTMQRLLPEISLTQAIQMPAEEYCAKILARFCSAALAHSDDNRGLLVNYDQLPDATLGTIAKHFNLEFDESELDQMNAVARFDAKTPQIFFDKDAARKREEASDASREAAVRWVNPIYEQLENRRSGSQQ